MPVVPNSADITIVTRAARVAKIDGSVEWEVKDSRALVAFESGKPAENRNLLGVRLVRRVVTIPCQKNLRRLQLPQYG